jgi:hypothetical protein
MFENVDFTNKKKLAKLKIKEEQPMDKTFFYLDSISNSIDIASIYLDKTAIPTEIIRTPKLDSIMLNDSQSFLMKS